MTHIPYKGTAPAMTDLIGGQVKVMFGSLSGAVAHIRSGRAVAIAVTDPSRSRLLPDVPTVAEGGIAGIEAPSWFCFLAPAGTPRDVIAKLNTEINRALGASDVIARMAELGLETTGSTPQELAQAMRTDYARYAKVIADTGIKLQ